MLVEAQLCSEIIVDEDVWIPTKHTKGLEMLGILFRGPTPTPKSVSNNGMNLPNKSFKMHSGYQVDYFLGLIWT